MKKLEVVLAVLLGITLAAVLIWGVAKATQDLSVVIAQGIGNITTQVE